MQNRTLRSRGWKNDDRRNIYVRALKVWFLTMITGVGWMVLEVNNYTEELGEWAKLFFQFGVILLFTLPLWYLGTKILRISSLARGKAEKALRLLGLTLLLNMLVYLPFLIMPLSRTIVVHYLGPFTIASIIFVFLVNLDWFIPRRITKNPEK
jgi:hypothetical protein